MFANFDFQLRDVDIYLGSIRSSAFLLPKCSFNNMMQLCYANGILPKQKFVKVTLRKCDKTIKQECIKGT